MRGINKHQASDILRVDVGIETHVESSERVPDQHERSGNACFNEESVQFTDDTLTRAWQRARIAPAIACPVVGTHSRESRHTWLRSEERRVGKEGRGVGLGVEV